MIILAHVIAALFVFLVAVAIVGVSTDADTFTKAVVNTLAIAAFFGSVGLVVWSLSSVADYWIPKPPPTVAKEAR